MSYAYEAEKKALFTESGVKTLLVARDTAKKLIASAGAFTAEKVMKELSGSTWTMMAALDYMVESGEIRRVTPKGSVWGQHEVFTGA